MGSSKKHAKGRLDKYYHLAKDQGYRARSAFKLIQLNKKYQFLANAKALIDLCAAPGGWLQVAHKLMPKQSLIIGVDLEKIKPIDGVITHIEDITTASCRTTLKASLKTWKADVVLHDGAPNVGVSWAQDAFTQSELVLSSCKLATDFLKPGGTFVTKVFRSKDYNKLIYVFNQLFGRVEATKPTASRTVSAEIFVVCQDYLAPKKIDPRLLDPKFAFKEMDDVLVIETDVSKIKAAQGALLNDLLHPERRKRHRDGYQDGDYTLHHANNVSDFIHSVDFLGILSRSNQLVFTDSTEDLMILKDHASDDIKHYLNDLKVLGKKQFKELIKWRDNLRIKLGISMKAVVEVGVEGEGKEGDEEEEEDVETMIRKENEGALQKLKRLKKRQRERKAKVLLKMQLGMKEPLDIGIDQDLGVLPEFDQGDTDDQNNNTDSDSSLKFESEDDAPGNVNPETGNDPGYNSDEELHSRIGRLDTEMDSMYQEYQNYKIDRNPKAKVKKIKEASAAFEEWYGIDTQEPAINPTPYDSSSDDSDSDQGELDIPMSERPAETVLSRQARIFFNDPIFDSIEVEKDEDGFEKGSLFDKELVMKATRKKSGRQVDSVVADKGFEIVAADPDYEASESETDVIDTPQAYTLAQKLITNSGRRDVIDGSFNRYAHNDPDLPNWFTQDESRHNKPTLPVTKEAATLIREKQRALDARPIKKVAEAKFRKQMRTQRRIEKASKKSEGLAGGDESNERSRLEAAAKVMSKAKRTVRGEKERIKVVVAKGTHKGVQGRPRGVKGRYKMVDGPMKKESRALKRVAKKQKKRSR